MMKKAIGIERGREKILGGRWRELTQGKVVVEKTKKEIYRKIRRIK